MANSIFLFKWLKGHLVEERIHSSFFVPSIVKEQINFFFFVSSIVEEWLYSIFFIPSLWGRNTFDFLHSLDSWGTNTFNFRCSFDRVECIYCSFVFDLVYFHANRLLTWLYKRETEIHWRKDNGNIKKQTDIDRHGPKPSSNSGQPPAPPPLIFHCTLPLSRQMLWYLYS